MAIACFLLVTFLPLRPLFSVPRLRLRIARSTSFDALFEVFLAMPAPHETFVAATRFADEPFLQDPASSRATARLTSIVATA